MIASRFWNRYHNFIMNNSSSCHRDFRCKTCQKLLFKGVLVESEIEVKCKRCQAMNQFVGEAAGKFICLVRQCADRVAVGNKEAR